MVASFFASTGLWALLSKLLDKCGAHNQMLLGLGHYRITTVAKQYLERGWITADEYENLHEYLYAPYLRLGGNGTVKGLMARVDALPIKSINGE
jgi:hypothetical protein